MISRVRATDGLVRELLPVAARCRMLHPPNGTKSARDDDYRRPSSRIRRRRLTESFLHTRVDAAFARRATARSAGLAASTAGVAAHSVSAVAARKPGPLALVRALAHLEGMAYRRTRRWCITEPSRRSSRLFGDRRGYE